MHGAKGINPFLFIWGGYTVLLGVAVLCTEQLELHRAMHGFAGPALDGFFSWFTHVGDGWVPTALALSILFIRDLRSFMMMALSCGLSALVTQSLKHTVDHDRPFMFKDQLGDMHWVEGLELHHHLSFPSGHATAAFSMCFALAVLVDKRAWGYAFGLLAILLAFSRVYLSQHFSEDILVGGAIGTLTTVLVYHWLYRSPFSQRTWLDRKLLT